MNCNVICFMGWGLVSFFFVLFLLGDCFGAEVYVSSTSNVTLDCGNVENPCGGIQAGINVVCNGSTEFLMNTLWLEPGTYNISEVITGKCPLSIQSTAGKESTSIAFISNHNRGFVSTYNTSINGITVSLGEGYADVFLFTDSEHVEMNDISFLHGKDVTAVIRGVRVDVLLLSNSSLQYSDVSSVISSQGSGSVQCNNIFVFNSSFVTTISIDGPQTLTMSYWNITNVNTIYSIISTQKEAPEYTLNIDNIYINNVSAAGGNVGTPLIASTSITVRDTIIRNVKFFEQLFDIQGDVDFQNVTISDVTGVLHLMECSGEDNLISFIACEFTDFVTIKEAFASTSSGVFSVENTIVNSFLSQGIFYLENDNHVDVSFSSCNISSGNTNFVIIVSHNGSLTVSHCDFTNIRSAVLTDSSANSIIQFAGSGPLDGSSVSISYTTISHNTLMALDISSVSSVTLTSVEIFSCSHPEMVQFRACSGYLSNMNMYNNNGTKFLGFYGSRLTWEHSTMNNNIFNDAGIALYTGFLVVNNITVSNNFVVSTIGTVFAVLEGHLSASQLFMFDNIGSFGVLSGVDADLTVTDSQFVNNTSYFGGSLYLLAEGEFTMRDSIIRDSKARDGAAMWIFGNITGSISNCSFSHNVASNSAGGIFMAGTASLSIDNSTFESNSALVGGCLVLQDKASPQITASTFAHCNSSTSGGAIVLDGHSTPTIDNCTIHHSFAFSIGSGLYLLSFAKLHIQNSLITENLSPNEGAGMYMQDSSKAEIENVTFSNNFAGSGAPALVMTFNSEANITQSLFQYNYCGSKGGAVATLSRSSASYLNCLFQHNSGNSGGAFYGTDYSTPTLANCTFYNNTASSKGGALYLSNRATAIILDSVFDNNQAQSGFGGAVLILDFAFASLNGTIMTNNEATYGGALYVNGNYSLDALDCLIQGNRATYSGGGFVLSESSISTWENCVCDSNSAASTSGGCFLSQDIASASFLRCNFTNNYSPNGGALSIVGILMLKTTLSDMFSVYSANSGAVGGAVVIGETGFWMDDYSFVSDNFASLHGGGLASSSVGVEINEAVFNNNSASEGGALYVSYASNFSGSIQNVLFTGNQASTLGGAVSLRSITVRNLSTGNWEVNPFLQEFSFMDNSYQFFNISMENNAAEYGGALFIDTLSVDTPTFGPRTLFLNNTANFGGAIAFKQYNEAFPIIYGGEFNENVAFYGGCNVAYEDISNVDSAEHFCVSCNFTCDINTGYQDNKGFASAPNHLGFNNTWNPCPGSVTLDTESITIAVFLYDQFSTEVKGEYLVDNPMSVQMIPSSSIISSYQRNQSLDPNSGAAIFNNTEFCGPDNSTVQVKYQASSISIASEECSILLYGCKEGYQVQKASNDESCATCVEMKHSKTWIIEVFLMILVLGLCLIIAILMSSFLGWRYWKKVKKDRLNALEIPDFSEKPSLTLEDILNDPAIPRLPWDEVEILRTIGKGASGLVSAGVWKPENGKEREIALKELLLGIQDFGIEVLEEFLVEIKFMSALVHKNVVRFIGICVSHDNSKLLLVTELMHYGSVRDLLDKKGKNLDFSMRLKFAKDTARGMEYLHGKKLIHRDLKSENLLVNKRWTCKVADFGISTVRPTITREMTCIGTPVYMAPEVLTKNKYSEKADVYSYGILLYEIFTGNRPYSEGDAGQMNQAQLMYSIINDEMRPSLAGLSRPLQQLVEDCWNIEPSLRPSFTEIIVRLTRLKGTTKESKDEIDNLDFEESIEPTNALIIN